MYVHVYVCVWVYYICIYVCMCLRMCVCIHSFIPDIYIAPLQETYSEALSVQLRSKRNVLRSLQKPVTDRQTSAEILYKMRWETGSQCRTSRMYVCMHPIQFTASHKNIIWGEISRGSFPWG